MRSGDGDGEGDGGRGHSHPSKDETRERPWWSLESIFVCVAV